MGIFKIQPTASGDLWAHRYDYTGSQITYMGSAYPGAATSAAKWRICKYAYDGSGNCTSILYANGTNGTELIWDNRATYTYS